MQFLTHFQLHGLECVKRSTRQTFVVELGVFEVIETVILEETSQMDTESVKNFKKFRYLGFRFKFWQNFDQLVYNVSVQQKSNLVFNGFFGEMMLRINNFHDEKSHKMTLKVF